MRPGRRRLSGVPRDGSGALRSRTHECETKEAYGLSLARRGMELKREGIDPVNAADALSGFTLGKLLLRHRANPGDPGGISQEQFESGQEWARVVHKHAAIQGFSLSIKTPSFVIVGGTSCAADPEEREIIAVRQKFRDCYNWLMSVCRDHGLGVRDVTYGVCVDNWPCERLSQPDHGRLRIGLNAVGRGLS